jgi:zinc D-Ala-D-Ala carboxypeptidase
MGDISKNFSLSEFTYSQSAARAGHPLLPDDKQRNYLIQLVRTTLQPIREMLDRPIVITSGFRDQWLNTLIGGAKDSQHMKGQAADFIVIGMTPHDVCKEILRSEMRFDQLISEFGRWTHISSVPGPAVRKVALTAKSSDGTTIYYDGIVA